MLSAVEIKRLPVHQNSWLLFEKYALPFFSDQCSVLEVGPDANPSTLQKIVGPRCLTWQTVDISNWLSETTYVASSPYKFPMEDDQYHVVLSSQVIEHVPHIWLWMKELARVCKPGGHVITISPVTWFYHEAPVDCWRIYPEGMKALSDEAGLQVILSTWESVEIDHFTKWLPESIRKKRVRFQRISPLLDLLGRALRSNFRGAYDTITIAAKPQLLGDESNRPTS